MERKPLYVYVIAGGGKPYTISRSEAVDLVADWKVEALEEMAERDVDRVAVSGVLHVICTEL